MIHHIRAHLTNGLGIGSTAFSAVTAAIQKDDIKADLLWLLSCTVAFFTIIHLVLQIKNQWKK